VGVGGAKMLQLYVLCDRDQADSELWV